MSLKDTNKAALLTAMLANVAVFLLFVQSGTLFTGGWSEAAKALENALPAGLGLVLIGVLNAQLSSQAKARLIYLRWSDPLPGAEAFTVHACNDPRIDITALEQAHGSPLPTTSREQNSLWYRLFKSVETDEAVTHAHREFLFTRDYACMSLMIFFVLGGTAVFKVGPGTQTYLYIAILAAQFALTLIAARNHGRRLVCTVLALKSAGR